VDAAGATALHAYFASPRAVSSGVVGALLRLVFIGGVVAAGHHVYTHVLPAALRQSSARRGEGEEEAEVGLGHG
jgi:hypothetical protein